MKKETMQATIKQPTLTPAKAAPLSIKLDMDHTHKLHVGKITSGPKGDSNGSR